MKGGGGGGKDRNTYRVKSGGKKEGRKEEGRCEEGGERGKIAYTSIAYSLYTRY